MKLERRTGQKRTVLVVLWLLLLVRLPGARVIVEPWCGYGGGHGGGEGECSKAGW